MKTDTITLEEIKILLGMDAQVPDGELRSRLESLNLSAEDKGLLWSLRHHSVEIGGQVVRVGARLLEMVVRGVEVAISRFPNTCGALLVGSVLCALAGMIPLLGAAIQTTLAPFLILAVAAPGLVADLSRQLRSVFIVRPQPGIAV